jgi:NAD(P)-dependent dehydrogenase (short-subunit alcohol dehydrogenase family)
MAERRFVGRVALVTGGASGMGRAIALAFAREGADVVIGDVDTEGLARTVAEASAEGARAVAEASAEGARAAEASAAGGATMELVATDVADAGAVERLVQHAVDRFGRLDHAVNAAAIEIERDELVDTDDDVFDRLVAVNLRSVFLCMKHELRAMLAAGHGGTIVNVGSTNSFRPQPHQVVYTATKHGVIGLTKAAAIDYARHGVRINAICPGAIDTPMLRAAIERRGRDVQEVVARLSLVDRLGTVDEIAAAALWLSSEASSFTIGHALAVDGGYLAR